MNKTNSIALFFVSLLVCCSLHSQSNINIVLARYSGQTAFLNGTTPSATCNSYMDLIPDGFSGFCVREEDSCFIPSVCASWCGDPWHILVNSDSTLTGYEPWTAATAATGRLYPNDSIYLKVKTFGDMTSWREFRGFKLYSTVGVSDHEVADIIKIIPNPTIHSFNIILSGSGEQAEMELLDATGRLLIQSAFQGNAEINVDTLPRGIYFVRVKGKDFVLTKRLVLID